MRQTVGILGTPVDVLDMDAVLGRLEQFVRERRFHQVATANTDFLINALEDPELRCILRSADLVIPDGMPLLWASRLMRSPLPERVTGADLVPRIAACAANKGYRIFMLGARPDVAQRARDRMLADNPGLQIVGCVSPPVAALMDMDHDGLLAEIRRARPDILLVAFGNPKQEKWIHMNRVGLADVPVCIGVGGTFDFIAGHTSRAPQWMQRAGLEWIHRLGQEPQRLYGRYRRDFGQFSRYLFRQWAVMRGQPWSGPAEVHSACTGDFTVISVLGDVDGRSVPRIQAAAEKALGDRTDLVFDFQRVTGIDGEGLGMLINMPKRAAAHRREMRLACVPPFIARILGGSQLIDGPYQVAATLTDAFNIRRQLGLSWEVRSRPGAALVEVCGAADVESVTRLERVCASLLQSGRHVDLDLRAVSYADLHLMSALWRLARDTATRSKLRLVAGDNIRELLKREKAADRFILLASPEFADMPAEQPHEAIDLLQIFEPEPAHAQSAP
jgi:N-acetylglucosaminyldiphosphoundecaprenol N-acetyl-beta-D-mannosaminyltransferase